MTDRAQCLGPVVIGGVGGSGTRVVATFLRELGFYMGDDLNSANDNLWFTFFFVRPKWFVESSDKGIFKGLRLFEKLMIGRPGLSRGEISIIFRAAIDMLFSDYLHWGRDRGSWPIKRMAGIWPIKRVVILMWLIERVVTMIRSRKLDPSAYIGWGWKEPNSHVYIKNLSETFDNLKYIHVVRHGLDMAYSSNQAQLHNWGSLFGVQMPNSSELLPQASLNYWIKSNETAMTLGEHLLGDRFLVMNFDDLCSAPQTGIEELVSFLELNEKNVNMNKLCNLCKTPRSLGRYREHDISIFSENAINKVRELGFVVGYNT